MALASSQQQKAPIEERCKLEDTITINVYAVPRTAATTESRDQGAGRIEIERGHNMPRFQFWISMLRPSVREDGELAEPPAPALGLAVA